MHAVPSIARTIRSNPAPSATAIEVAARSLAIAAGELGPLQHLVHLPEPRVRYYRNLVRLVTNPAGLAEAMQIQLRRTLTQQIHGTEDAILRFDNLPIEDRYDIADTALVAWETVQSELAGTSADIPAWERNCLTFTGEYDPRLLLVINHGTVQ